MSKEARFRGPNDVIHLPEEGSIAFDMMMADGAFTRINDDGTDYIQPVPESPELAREPAAEGANTEAVPAKPAAKKKTPAKRKAPATKAAGAKAETPQAPEPEKPVDNDPAEDGK
jgi:hypothetical protein